MVGERRSTLLATLPRGIDHRATAVGLLWGIEVFLIQCLTLRPEVPLAWYTFLIFSMIRLLLDLLLTTGLVLLLRRWALGLFGFWLVLSVALATYRGYFGRPLSILALAYGEPVGAINSGLEFLDWKLAVGLLLAFALRVKFLFSEASQGCRLYGFYLIVAHLALVAGLQLVDPLERVRGSASIARLGTTYGYLPVWLGEAFYLGGDDLVELTIRDQEREEGRRAAAALEGLLPDLPYSPIVLMVQVESLDYSIIGMTHNEKLVAPALTELASRSILMKVRAIHNTGTTDGEFAMLTGRLPSKYAVSYRVPGALPKRTLPACLRHNGFGTVLVHGNSGEFFGRRLAAEAIGFEQVIFREELKESHGVAKEIRGWGMADRDVFRVVTDRIQSSKGPLFAFVITLTSHAPFDWIPSGSDLLIQNPSSLRERFLNSINYTDNALAELIASLPAGALVVVYGDHESGALAQKTTTDEYVPVIVSLKDKNLDLNHMEAERLLTSGKLDQLDVGRWLLRAIPELCAVY